MDWIDSRIFFLRRVKRFLFTSEILQTLHMRKEIIEKIRNLEDFRLFLLEVFYVAKDSTILPSDSQLLGAGRDPSRCGFYLTVSSMTFEEVPEGEEYPEVTRLS